jgi:putative Mn2+ efflux pump MntP
MAGFLKMAACCGGMLLLLPALGLVSAGGLAAVAGSALSVAAALACPIGMYFMMRGMMKREQGRSPAEQKKQLSDDTVNQGVKR